MFLVVCDGGGPDGDDHGRGRDLVCINGHHAHDSDRSLLSIYEF